MQIGARNVAFRLVLLCFVYYSLDCFGWAQQISVYIVVAGDYELEALP